MYKVLTRLYGDEWEDCWMVDDQPQLFTDVLQAKIEIKLHILECRNAVKDGFMEDAPTIKDFKIEEVTQ